MSWIEKAVARAEADRAAGNPSRPVRFNANL
jgi:hypothetical protein